VHAVLDHVRQHATSLNVDEHRIGIWACSGHVPNALSLLMQDAPGSLKCAALCYGYMLDLDGSAGVAKAAAQWGFVTPSAGRSVDDLRRDVPLFLARAGQDQQPGLNDAFDRFVARALGRNLPLTCVNHPTGPHAFDLFEDSETSRDIIGRILAFLRFHLLA
jgi:hypothetical protein